MTSLNPYMTPDTTSPIHKAPSEGLMRLRAVTAVTLSSLFTITMFLSQPKLERMFSEFGLKLPLVTLLSCSRLLPVLMLIATIASLVISLLPNYHVVANRWNAVHIIVSILAFAFYAWGMISPLMDLITGLSR